MEERQCPVCGRMFVPDHARSRYCSEACRKTGKQAIRKQWEAENDYTAQMRDIMRKKRAEERDKRDQAEARRREIIRQEGDAVRAQARKSLEERAANGDYFAQMLQAREAGNDAAYWEAFRNYEILWAEQQGKLSGRTVNGISVYLPDFAERVLQSFDDYGTITSSMENNYQTAWHDAGTEGE